VTAAPFHGSASLPGDAQDTVLYLDPYILSFHSRELNLNYNLLRCLGDIATGLPLARFRYVSAAPRLMNHLLEKAPHFLLHLQKRLGM
jgi:hypothetical protein